MVFEQIYDSVTTCFGSVWAIFASLGWYVLAVVAVLFYYSPQIKDKYNGWKRKRDEEEYAAKYHKNPDLMQERLEGLEAARQRMQQKYAREVELAKQKEEERKERKKQELLELTEGQDGGRKLGTLEEAEASTSSGTKSNKLKQEYNPLMGPSGRGYRAPKRSCCGKGGCG